MISIIVCSKHPQIGRELKQNIESTIGNIKYEIIWIDNSKNQYSIFQAYNEGVRRSKYEYLCFMHEDVLFRSKAWGELIVRSFQSDKNIGMLGVVGTAYVPRFATWWWNDFAMRGHLIQGHTEEKKYRTELVSYDLKLPNEVVAVDGLWICLRASMFHNGVIRWDEERFGGFHFYDFDMSLQVFFTGMKTIIVPDILVEHQSFGQVNDVYMDSLLLFHEKWHDKLPLKTSAFQLPDNYNEEMEILRKYANVYKKNYRSHSILLSRPHRFVSKICRILKKK